jgi:hypothetical protein
VKLAFTDDEYLQWAKTKPAGDTYDGIDNYSCPIADFLGDTGRAGIPYVLSEEWYDEALLTKKGKPSAVHKLPKHAGRATFALHPNNTFRHIVVRLELLMAKQDVNDFHFVIRDAQ